jgi:hypothetical protein
VVSLLLLVDNVSDVVEIGCVENRVDSGLEDVCIGCVLEEPVVVVLSTLAEVSVVASVVDEICGDVQIFEQSIEVVASGVGFVSFVKSVPWVVLMEFFVD